MTASSDPRRRLASGALCAVAFALIASLTTGRATARDFVLQPITITDHKAVYGRIESRFVIPARTRIGGTLVELDVAEGALVEAGKTLARVVDDKLALQLEAAGARVRAVQSELANARLEYERLQALMARGAATQARIDQVRTQVDVLGNQVLQAQAERAVIVQQASEGAVTAPADGRVLTLPARRGAVVMPGEPVATIAGGGLFLRLAIPERHAALLAVDAPVRLADLPGSAAGANGRIEKIYPQIENGRVIADVAVANLSDAFVGARVLVRVPVATRAALAVPPDSVATRAGNDMVRLATASGPREVTVVIGELVDTPSGPQREILSGLKAGDRVILP
jgi:RND family efflux transporter MFP subunit